MRALALAAALTALAPVLFAQHFRSAPPHEPVGTVISGGPVSGIWTKLGSPYRVIADITVGTLTVEAGVEVRAAPGVEIVVQGALTTQGTAQEPVLFSSSKPSLRWNGLRLVSASGVSSFEHTRIERSALRGLEVGSSMVSAFSHCEVVDNAGGGVYVLSSFDFHMEDCLIEDNALTSIGLTSGGGVFVDIDGNFSMERCVVRGNSARDLCGEARGGGISIQDAFEIVLTDVLIEDNECVATSGMGCSCTATVVGGGLAFGSSATFSAGLDATLTRCIVRENRALVAGADAQCSHENVHAFGGGIFYFNPLGVLELRNVLVAGNVAWADGDVQTIRGAGLYFRGDSQVVTNSTLARNTAVDGQWIPSAGGVTAPGLFAAFGSTEIRNSVLFENDVCVSFDPPSSAGCTGGSPGDPIAGGAGVAVTYSDVEGGQAGLGNLNLAPLFAGPGTSYADVSISAGSPCVDAGNPAGLYADVSFPPSLGGARSDMGHNGGPHAAGWLLWNF